VPDDAEVGRVEAQIVDERGALILSKAGASGVVGGFLSPDDSGRSKLECSNLKPDTNTNLMSPRTCIPVVNAAFATKGQAQVVLATSVFAISSEANGGRGVPDKSLRDRWENAPKLSWSDSDDLVVEG
jgi:hypothetical protein